MLNSLIRIQANTGIRYIVFGIEVYVLLQAQEHRLKMVVEQIESKHEARLKRQAENFQSEVKDLRSIAKECHILFVEEVQK